ncbi:MAG: sensor histidine kinase [Luteitalea sp.]|nr:sensor histidine kinase [Luteitalea sp.]
MINWIDTLPGERTAPVGASRAYVSLAWLLKVRWGAVFGQAATILIAHAFLSFGLPLAVLFALLGIEALSNALAGRYLARGGVPWPRVAGLLLALDCLLLTAMLAWTGGALNPFSIFYLVYITLAAVVLDARWTWALTAFAALGYGSLFLQALRAPDQWHVAFRLSSHLQAMWWAFLLAASLTAYFVLRLSRLLEARERDAARAQAHSARHARLAAVTTLAAGAAHELSTPLATIAVAAHELERSIARLPQPAREALASDGRLIEAELQRCRAILDRMAARAGEPAGELPVPLPLRALLDETLGAFPPEDSTRIDVVTPAAPDVVRVPARSLVTALVGLLKNALEASPPASHVTLAVTSGKGRLRLRVEDRGAGMAPEVLARAGEPFFTTKPPGAGLGLGLFLTRALAEQLGGALRLESAPGSGTAATLELPLDHTAVSHSI